MIIKVLSLVLITICVSMQPKMRKNKISVTTIDLVDIHKINPNIILDIRYATKNNFTKKKIYPCAKCYLRKKVVLKLDKIQKELEKKDLGLKIWDGYRRLSDQQTFWDLVPDKRYVQDPAKGSKHNRGCAVDLTLVDKHGKELLMPTEFDNFTEKAHANYMELPALAIAHRQLLKDIMVKYGFIPARTEWWHFEDTEWEMYEILDIAIDALG